MMSPGVSRRWCDGLVEVATIAAMQALPIGAHKTGWLVSVASKRDAFMYDASSSLATDAKRVFATSSGTGRWIRMCLASVGCQSQQTWYIDPVSGDDEASGVDAGHPIKTFAEWYLRTGGTALATMDVHILSSLPATDPIDADLRAAPGCSLTFRGTVTTASSGTLSGVTARDPATNVPNEIVDGSLDWTSSVGKRVYFSRTQSYAWVVKSVSAGHARISVPHTATDDAGGAADCAEQTLNTDDAYAVQTLPTVYVVRASCSSTMRWGVEPFSGYVAFNDLHLSRLNADSTMLLQAWPQSLLVLRRCSLSTMAFVEGQLALMACRTSGACELRCASFLVSVYLYAHAHCNTDSGYMRIVNGSVVTYSPCHVQGSRVYIMSNGMLSFNDDFGVFDVSGNGIDIRANGVLKHAAAAKYLYGSGNTTCGMAVYGGGRFITSGLAKCMLTGGSSRDLILGKSGNTSLIPNIEASAGGALPSASACTTWANIAASPFSGTILDYGSGAFVGPET